MRRGTQEAVPYFVSMLQANDPLVMSAAKKNITSSVLFCMIDRCEPGRGSSGQSRLPLRKRCPALRIPSSSLAGWSLTRRPRLGVCLHTQRARQQAPRPGPSPQHPRRIRNLRQLGGLQQMERGQHLTRHTCGRCAAGWSGRRFAAAGRCGGETRDRQPASRYLAQHRSAGAAWAGSLAIVTISSCRPPWTLQLQAQSGR